MHSEDGRRRVGAIIRGLRERRGWTQQDLARKTDHTHSYISRLERGKLGRIYVADICGLCEALGSDVWAILVVAEIFQGEPTAAELEDVSAVLCYARKHEGSWAVIRQCVEMAQAYPQAWKTISLLARKPGGETFS